MPDHIHGIVVITETFAGKSPNSGNLAGRLVGAQHAAPVRQDKMVVGRGSLGAIVRSYKSAVTREINHLPGDKDHSRVWHRNYYEHIIRDDKELEDIRRYILYNAQK